MIRKVYFFVLEILFAALLIYPYFPPKEMREGVFAVIAILVFFFWIHSWLLARFGRKAKAAFLLLVLPLLLALALHFSFNPLYAILAGMVIFWRGLVLSDDDSDDRDVRLAAAAMLVAMPAAISASVKHGGVLKITILLFVLEIVLVMIGRFAHNLSQLGKNNGQKSGFIIFFGKVIGLLVLLGLLLALTLDYFKALFFFVIKNAAMGLGLLVSPLMRWLEGSMLKQSAQMILKEDGLNVGPDASEAGQAGPYSPLTDSSLLILATFGIIIVFAYLYKRKSVFESVRGPNPSPQLTSMGTRLPSSQKKRKAQPPENKLRLEFYKLETFASKKGVGRLSYETLEEWWKRIGIHSNRRLAELYGEIRYGSMPVEEENLEYARSEIKAIKEQMKTFRNKKRVKKE
ncbi:hypothetical protein D1B31_22245 [Neobacillus notoginsengisoli]|uniref:DUF4129 domain-containing protein n=1 Tax=Neobacillus notoginsengisoli TaxID=1578198 RepID=A0A417YFE1_9BACI|nr:hypothetical protein [Neobacillus notoginsengisoli]RHW31406.1 hypothetical protein D1B31_22245 [Neobacillus notoginsengisoli]